MKTIYTILFTLIISTSSLSAQIEGMLGDILKEVQDKVGDAQQTSEKEADSKATKEFKNKIKFFISGINDLDKYSAELKCIYLMIKLARMYEGLEGEIIDEEICQKQYDLYGMQLMTLASTTGIGYCFDNILELTELINEGELSESLPPEYYKLQDEYFTVFYEYSACVINNGEDYCLDKMNSALERDFKITLINFLGTYAQFYSGDVKDTFSKENLKKKFETLISYLLYEYNPVMALGKSVKIGQKMKALPCSDGRTYN